MAWLAEPEVWYTHAMLLHFAESESTELAVAGAQVTASQDALRPVKLQTAHSTVTQNSLPLVPLPEPLEQGSLAASELRSLVMLRQCLLSLNMHCCIDAARAESENITESLQKRSFSQVLKIDPVQQSERFSDYLTAMQCPCCQESKGPSLRPTPCRYSLLHLTGDYPIVQYSVTAKPASGMFVQLLSCLSMLFLACCLKLAGTLVLVSSADPGMLVVHICELRAVPGSC